MKSLARHSHWIFDMDGTLTVPVHDFDAIRRELNIELGKPILEAIAEMPTHEADRTRAKLHALEMELAASGVAQPGAVDFLSRLKQRGCTLGILTRNAGDIAHATLAAAKLADFFQHDHVVARDDCPPKPDPAGIEMLLAKWQASAGDAVMIGDYVFDIEAGKRASVTTVHFDTEATFNWPQWTDVAVSSYAQLDQLLDS
jgi:HAD superfamily hydrolase (TIGR01509 family)